MLYRPGCKKNPLCVIIAWLHEAYYFWRVLAMSTYQCAIVYGGLWARVIRNYKIPPGTLRILHFHYSILYHHPLANIIFVCDADTSYVITYATENIQAKAHQCSLVFWCSQLAEIMACNVRFSLQPTQFTVSLGIEPYCQLPSLFIHWSYRKRTTYAILYKCRGAHQQMQEESSLQLRNRCIK